MKRDNVDNLWVFASYGNFDSKLNKLAKKRSKEHTQVVANLERLKHILNVSGKSPYFLSNKWIHSEADGVIAVDQGQSKSRKEIRAYIFPDTKNKTLYLLTIGDKSSQQKDNNYCRKIVKQIMLEKEEAVNEEI